MTDLADKKEALKKHVRALLVSSPVELTVKELERDFHMFIGVPLDYKGIGYATIEDFLRDVQDAVFISWKNGMMTLRANSDGTDTHIAKLVSKQKVNNKTKFAVYRNRRPPRQYSEPQRFEDRFKSNRIPPKRIIPAYVRHQVQGLFRSFPNGLSINDVDSAFGRKYGTRLLFKNYGFYTMLELFQSLPDLVQIHSSQGEQRIFPAGHTKLTAGSKDDYRASDRDNNRGGENKYYRASERDNYRAGRRDDYKSSDKDNYRASERDNYRAGSRDDYKSSDRDNYRASDRDTYRASERDNCRADSWEENRASGRDYYSRQNSGESDKQVQGPSQPASSQDGNNNQKRPSKGRGRRRQESGDSEGHVGHDAQSMTSSGSGGSSKSRTDRAELLEQEIRQILEKRKEGIWAARLPHEYADMFGKPLDYRDYGYLSVVDFISSMPDTVRIERPCPRGDWMLYDARLAPKQDSQKTEKGMLCDLCIRHQRRPKKCVIGRAVWVDLPCSSIRRAACVAHKETESHKEACLFEAAASSTSQGIEAGFVREEAVNRKAMIAAMTVLYMLCKEEIPHTTKFGPVLDVVQHVGGDILKTLNKGANQKYTSMRHISDLVTIFYEVIWEKIAEEVRSSPFYSVMVDETTDVATTNQLIVYLRYLKKGKSCTTFGGVVALPNGKADTIRQAILSFLDSNRLPLERMCAFGSDGAAVMVGRLNGVSTQLRDRVPHLLSNHCVAHRLALASAQAAAKVPYLEKFKRIVEQLYRFYNFSSVRTATLKEIQNVLNEPSVKITEAKDVRWLSHDRAVSAIRRSLPALVTSLEYEATEKADAQAEGLSMFLQRYEFVAAVYMMCDILPILSALSRCFQTRDGMYSAVGSLVAGTISSVKALKENPGQHFRSLPDAITSLTEQPFKFKAPTDRQVQDFRKNVLEKFVDAVVENLERRFPNTAEIDALRVFDPQMWPEDQTECDEFGNQDIEMLADRFRTSLPTPEDIIMEYKLVKNTVKSNQDLNQQSMSRIMEEVAGPLATSCPNLAKIAAVGLLIPASTAVDSRATESRQRRSSGKSLLEDTQERIQQVLQSRPYGVRVNQFAEIYKEFTGQELPVKELGFDAPHQLCLSMADSIIQVAYIENVGTVLFLSDTDLSSIKTQALHSPEAPVDSSRPSDVVGPGCHYMPVMCPDGDQYTGLYVSNIVNPGLFWVILRHKDKSLALENLMDNLDAVYAQITSDDYKMPPSLMVPGQVCVTLFPEDNNWHRGVIIGSNSDGFISVCVTLFPEDNNWHPGVITGANTDGFTSVYFVDYGNTASVDKSTIRYLKREFLSLPAQAIQARLANVHPPSGKWKVKSRNRLLEMCRQKPLVAYITKVKCQIMSICLTDTNDPRVDVHINDTLVKEGLATFHPDEDYPEDLQLIQHAEVPNYSHVFGTTQAPRLPNAAGDNKPTEPETTDAPETVAGDCLVKWIQLTKDHVLHIINLDRVAHVVSAEVSSFIWEEDILSSMLKQKKMDVPKTVIDSDKYPGLFQDLTRYEVKSMKAEMLGRKQFLSLYPLDSVPSILRVFLPDSEELVTSIEELCAKFDPDSQYWKSCEVISNKPPEQVEMQISFEDKEMALQALQIKRKRILQRLMSEPTSTEQTVNDLNRCEIEILMIKQDLEEERTSKSSKPISKEPPMPTLKEAVIQPETSPTVSAKEKEELAENQRVIQNIMASSTKPIATANIMTKPVTSIAGQNTNVVTSPSFVDTSFMNQSVTGSFQGMIGMNAFAQQQRFVNPYLLAQPRFMATGQGMVDMSQMLGAGMPMGGAPRMSVGMNQSMIPGMLPGLDPALLQGTSLAGTQPMMNPALLAHMGGGSMPAFGRGQSGDPGTMGLLPGLMPLLQNLNLGRGVGRGSGQDPGK